MDDFAWFLLEIIIICFYKESFFINLKHTRLNRLVKPPVMSFFVNGLNGWADWGYFYFKESRGFYMSAADELALKIAAQPPISVELAKRMVWRSRFDDLSWQVDMESRGIQICFGTEDVRASVEAFMNKQPPPKYKGY